MVDLFEVGQYCREYRLNVLDMTLTSFCKHFNINIKNVSAFEHGRANNINYLYYYYIISTQEQRKHFSKELFDLVN